MDTISINATIDVSRSRPGTAPYSEYDRKKRDVTRSNSDTFHPNTNKVPRSNHHRRLKSASSLTRQHSSSSTGVEEWLSITKFGDKRNQQKQEQEREREQQSKLQSSELQKVAELPYNLSEETEELTDAGGVPMQTSDADTNDNTHNETVEGDVDVGVFDGTTFDTSFDASFDTSIDQIGPPVGSDHDTTPRTSNKNLKEDDSDNNDAPIQSEYRRLTSIGSNYYKHQQFEQAIENYSQAVAILEPKVDAIVNNSSNTHTNKKSGKAGKNETGSRDSKSSSSHQSSLIKQVELAAIYNNMGTIYSKHYHEDPSQTEHLDSTNGSAHQSAESESSLSQSQSLTYFHKSLLIRERIFGKKHPETIATLNNIGSVHFSRNEYDTALRFYKKAAKSHKGIGSVKSRIRERVKKMKGEDSSGAGVIINSIARNDTISKTFSNIGSVHYKRGSYSKAKEYYSRALDIQKKELKANDGKSEFDKNADCLALATIYSNIGLLYVKLGENEKALFAHTKALELRSQSEHSQESISWRERLDISSSHYCIGNIYVLSSDHDLALEAYKQTLEIRLDILVRYGTAHENNRLLNISIITAYNAVGLTQYRMRQYSEAIANYEGSIGLCEESLGSSHPTTGMSYNNLGTAYYNTHNYEPSLSFYLKALSNKEEILDIGPLPNHPSMYSLYTNIGAVYWKLENKENAKRYFHKAFEVDSERFRRDHAHSSRSFLREIGLLEYFKHRNNGSDSSYSRWSVEGNNDESYNDRYRTEDAISAISFDENKGSASFSGSGDTRVPPSEASTPKRKNRRVSESDENWVSRKGSTIAPLGMNGVEDTDLNEGDNGHYSLHMTEDTDHHLRKENESLNSSHHAHTKTHPDDLKGGMAMDPYDTLNPDEDAAAMDVDVDVGTEGITLVPTEYPNGTSADLADADPYREALPKVRGNDTVVDHETSDEGGTEHNSNGMAADNAVIVDDNPMENEDEVASAVEKDTYDALDPDEDAAVATSAAFVDVSDGMAVDNAVLVDDSPMENEDKDEVTSAVEKHTHDALDPDEDAAVAASADVSDGMAADNPVLVDDSPMEDEVTSAVEKDTHDALDSDEDATAAVVDIYVSDDIADDNAVLVDDNLMGDEVASAVEKDTYDALDPDEDAAADTIIEGLPKELGDDGSVTNVFDSSVVGQGVMPKLVINEDTPVNSSVHDGQRLVLETDRLKTNSLSEHEDVDTCAGGLSKETQNVGTMKSTVAGVGHESISLGDIGHNMINGKRDESSANAGNHALTQSVRSHITHEDFVDGLDIDEAREHKSSMSEDEDAYIISHGVEATPDDLGNNAAVSISFENTEIDCEADFEDLVEQHWQKRDLIDNGDTHIAEADGYEMNLLDVDAEAKLVPYTDADVSPIDVDNGAAVIGVLDTMDVDRDVVADGVAIESAVDYNTVDNETNENGNRALSNVAHVIPENAGTIWDEHGSVEPVTDTLYNMDGEMLSETDAGQYLNDLGHDLSEDVILVDGEGFDDELEDGVPQLHNYSKGSRHSARSKTSHPVSSQSESDGYFVSMVNTPSELEEISTIGTNGRSIAVTDGNFGKRDQRITRNRRRPVRKPRINSYLYQRRSPVRVKRLKKLAHSRRPRSKSNRLRTMSIFDRLYTHSRLSSSSGRVIKRSSIPVKTKSQRLYGYERTPYYKRVERISGINSSLEGSVFLKLYSMSSKRQIEGRYRRFKVQTLLERREAERQGILRPPSTESQRRLEYYKEKMDKSRRSLEDALAKPRRKITIEEASHLYDRLMIHKERTEKKTASLRRESKARERQWADAKPRRFSKGKHTTQQFRLYV